MKRTTEGKAHVRIPAAPDCNENIPPGRNSYLSALERRITRIEELVRGYRDALEVDPEAVARRLDNFDSLM